MIEQNKGVCIYGKSIDAPSKLVALRKALLQIAKQYNADVNG